MKRMMLVATTALTLGTPALAQSQAETTVSQTLMQMGYDQAAIDMLSDAEVAEFYVAITSEDGAALETAIAASTLATAEADAMADTGMPNDARQVVANRLADAGYSNEVINGLSDAQVAELYVIATSEDETALERAMDGFDLSNADTSVVSDAEQTVIAELEMRGYAKEQIANFTDGEITEIFIALNSGDETAVERAITSALNS